LESLSREDLVKLVQKLWLEKDEAQKQMETAKKEAEESAKRAEVLFKFLWKSFLSLVIILVLIGYLSCHQIFLYC
jgi:hypothetical protein